jgi:hypothetical protein
LIIEFFDSPQVATAAITLLQNIVLSGHIMSWRATCHGKAAPKSTTRRA